MTADASRDDEVRAHGRFTISSSVHEDQTNAQLGGRSNEIQTLGLKKKGEYKSPAKKKTH